MLIRAALRNGDPRSVRSRLRLAAAFRFTACVTDPTVIPGVVQLTAVSVPVAPATERSMGSDPLRLTPTGSTGLSRQPTSPRRLPRLSVQGVLFEPALTLMTGMTDSRIWAVDT